MVAELQLKAAQHEASAAALQDAQKQLQAKSDALASTQQQLREEQRGRAAAEAAVQRAERALERAKTSLQDKLDSKEENLLVYGRSVQEVGDGAGRNTCCLKRDRSGPGSSYRIPTAGSPALGVCLVTPSSVSM